MAKSLNILLMTICLASCGQTKTAIAILPYKEYQNWIFTNCKQAKLSNKEYVMIEHILRKCIKDYNQGVERYFNNIKEENPGRKLNKDDFFIDLKKYKRQYIAIINDKGEKEVWINCFCANRFENW